MELGAQPGRCASARQRGGKAATGRKRDCSAGTKPPPSPPHPHCWGIRHTGLEMLPVSSNLDLQLSQAPFSADGNFVPHLNQTPPFASINFTQINFLHQEATREAHSSHSPDPFACVQALDHEYRCHHSEVSIFRGTSCSTNPPFKQQIQKS